MTRHRRPFCIDAAAAAAANILRSGAALRSTRLVFAIFVSPQTAPRPRAAHLRCCRQRSAAPLTTGRCGLGARVGTAGVCLRFQVRAFVPPFLRSFLRSLVRSLVRSSVPVRPCTSCLFSERFQHTRRERSQAGPGWGHTADCEQAQLVAPSDDGKKKTVHRTRIGFSSGAVFSPPFLRLRSRACAYRAAAQDWKKSRTWHGEIFFSNQGPSIQPFTDCRPSRLPTIVVEHRGMMGVDDDFQPFVVFAFVEHLLYLSGEGGCFVFC